MKTKKDMKTKKAKPNMLGFRFDGFDMSNKYVCEKCGYRFRSSNPRDFFDSAKLHRKNCG